MNRRILVVIDQIQAGWVEEARQAEGDVHYFSIVLGSSGARYLRQNQEAFQDLHHSVIPLENYAESAQHHLQTFYPEFVYHFPRYVRLAGLTLLDLLSRQEGVNLWWLGGTCEKSPFRGPLIKQLYALALLREVLNNGHFDEIWLWLQDADLRSCIEEGIASLNQRVRSWHVRGQRQSRQWLRKGQGPFLFVRLIALRIFVVTHSFLCRSILWVCKVRRAEPGSETPRVGLYSRYPILWRNPYSLNQEERYFSHLAARLRERVRVFYIVMVSDWPWQLWKHRHHLATVFSDQNIVPLSLYLTLADFLRVLFDVSLPLCYLRYRWQMAPALRVRFLGWNISGLWNAELCRTLTGAEIHQNLLRVAAVRRVTSKLEISMLINPLEFQPMERAIWAGARGHATTVAFQHSTFCRNHFMYFFKEAELKSYIDEAVGDPSPLPDYYIVAGTWPYEIMLHNGVPASRLGLCGAIRYNDLPVVGPDWERQSALKRDLNVPLEKTAVLVLTSQSRDESIEMIDALADASSDLGGQFVFLFKCHYHCRIEDYIEQIFGSVSPSVEYRNLDVDGTLYHYIRGADVVLVGATTAAVEALALGHLPIIYNNPAILNLSSLMDFSGTALFVSTPEQLVTALKRISSGDLDRQSFVKDRANTLGKVFYRLDGNADERLVSFLREKGSL